MTSFKSAALFTALGLVLASLAGPLMAAPDKTLGMAILSANVNGDATLHSGAGAVDVTSGSVGIYQVYFNRDIDGCSPVASVGRNQPAGANHSDGVATANVAGLPAPTNRVDVYVRSVIGGGAYVERDFHLLVFCPR